MHLFGPHSDFNGGLVPPFDVPIEDWLFWWDGTNPDSYAGTDPATIYNLIDGTAGTTPDETPAINTTGLNSKPTLTRSSNSSCTINWTLENIDNANEYYFNVLWVKDGAVNSGDDGFSSSVFYGRKGGVEVIEQGFRNYNGNDFSGNKVRARLRGFIDATNDIMQGFNAPSGPCNNLNVSARNVYATNRWDLIAYREGASRVFDNDTASGPFTGSPLNEFVIELLGGTQNNFMIAEIQLFKVTSSITNGTFASYFNTKWGTSFI